MSWITDVAPKIKTLFKRDAPDTDSLWIRCPDSGQVVFQKDVEANQWVIPGSGHHMRLSAIQRLALTFDGGQWTDVPVPEGESDPLKFRDTKRYTDRLKEARTKTGLADAIKVGTGTVEGLPMTVAAHDPDFIGGSLGVAAGEVFIRCAETAIERGTPYVVFTASGGARMQEGMLSLMQMARTTVLIQRLREGKLPYIVVLTNPTTGGVTASYAMLGDVHMAEPGALIGFAGPRVIEQTIREHLPDGFQRAEFLKEHGMVDMVVHRHDLRSTLARLCSLLMRLPAHGTGTTSDALADDWSDHHEADRPAPSVEQSSPL
ncbi:acetyl-CoA carboxylase carboxyltransferase subunit beta [Microvirga sp. HBU67558]|uniref:acetyl-CoA carboxylase, carboxyltransferase subunit beta n=1 Tax=Microvirga TaxID=186650 RepID=UPI001B3836EA|nr:MULTISPECIES: acetyl-CoA carboxylase, carboxyltransferase subunit beta [unclassified Microvirga]MBQ0821503.1 acetyl-CoA carboxylase carboxyltransferase subunit beta [Microvirga sp. HBU67558]